MTTACMRTLSRVVGAHSIGDIHGDGHIILIGDGEARGMPDGMTLGIGVRIGIIRIGDTRVQDTRDVRWLDRA